MPAQLHFGAGNSVTFGSTNANGTGTTQSFTKASLTNLKVGDLLVAWFGGHGTTTGSTVTPPSGWVRCGAAIGSPTMSTSRNSGMWYFAIPDQATLDAMPVTLTWTISATSSRGGFVVARATGIDLTAPIDSAATDFSGAINMTSFDITAITTTNATTLLVGGFFRHNSAGTTVPTCTSFMTDFQEYNTTPTSMPTVVSTSAVLGYTTLSTAGSTGTVRATVDQVASTFGGELVAFKALPDVPVATSPTVVVASVTTATDTISTTQFTINKPAGLQDGDLMIVTVSAQTSTSTADFACNGWKRIGSPYVAVSTAYRITGIYAKAVPTALAETATSYTFASTDPTGGRIAATAFIVRGADLTTITAGAPAMAGGSGTTLTMEMGMPTANGSLLLMTYNGQFTSGISYAVATPPSGMTQVASVARTGANGTTTPDVVFSQSVDPTDQGNRTLVWGGPSSQTSAAAVYIRKIGAVDVVTGPAVHKTYYTSAMGLGTQAAGVYYTSATDTLKPALEMRPFPEGYGTIANMLAQTPFYVAYRGGSRDWPEMSLHAYTQSGYWGAGALEFSVMRTADGVYFGLHDQYLDRTSLGVSTTTLNPSTMTWAEVQNYQILGSVATNNPSQSNRPYMKLDQLLSIYSTHVIFIDTKYIAPSYFSEVFAIMDAAPNNPTNRFVAKAFGGGNSLANAARAAGYKSWGYFYQADVSTNLPNYQAAYDILGMDYNADAASWTAVKSYGKPVIAHILPDASAATKSASYGANGYMVSGIKAIITRHI